MPARLARALNAARTWEPLCRLSARYLRRGPFAWMGRWYFRGRYPIIYYHGVWRPGSPQQRLFAGTTIERFVDDLECLGQFFEFASLERVLATATPSLRQRPLLAVTFDDNHDLFASGAVAAMAAAGVPATVFVNTFTVGYQGLMWQHALMAIRRLRGDERFLNELNRLQARLGGEPIVAAGKQLPVTRKWPASRKEEYLGDLWRACDMPAVEEILAECHPYLDLPQLRDWMARGHAVGFHTRTHPWCSRLSAAEVQAELVDPAVALKRDLQIGWLPFAYPFGERLTPAMEEVVVRSGVFSCMLGVSGFSRRGTPHHHVRRLDAEPGAQREVFGRAVLASAGRPDRPYSTLD
jgi:peptidoglycan/xylan/chitin deacetylase (PgdA/CDA1 family)